MQSTVWSSVDHYENFPVGSWLMPARLRPAVMALYHFARQADDIADEGDASPCERLNELDLLDRALCTLGAAPRPADQPPTNPSPEPGVIAALRPHIDAHQLPIIELRALINAFKQDVTVNRYASRQELLHYCERSANPVGRLLLRLFRIDEDDRVALSDKICSALQLINFLQDVGIDWRKGRVYLPQESLARLGCSDADIADAVERGQMSNALRQVILFECEHAGALLASGTPLIRRVPVRLALELRAITAGGRRILDRIIGAQGDVFNHRPKLGWADAPALLRLALLPPRT